MNITLDLSNKEIKRLSEKAVAAGMSVKELLEGFIGDLTDGEHTNGSDERDLANQWYNRSRSYSDRQTFLQFLIEWDNFKSIADNLKRAVELELNLAAANISGGVSETKETAIQEEISYLRKEIDDYYTEYAQTTDRPQSYEDATGELYDYITELEKLGGPAI